MNSISSLIVRLERGCAPDRRLDAEIVATVLGPPGCIINPIPSPDGWDIETQPDADGDCTYWREAEDVFRLTHLLEDAIAFTKAARPNSAAPIFARTFQAAPPAGDLTAEAYEERLARRLVAEVLRSAAAEHFVPLSARVA